MGKGKGMIQKHLDEIKKLGFYYELKHLLELQREECLKSITKTDFYIKHKNDFPKSYITHAPTPEELENWKSFKPLNNGWSDQKPDFKEDCILITATKFKDGYEYKLFEIKYYTPKYEAGYLAAFSEDGYEWGDIADLKADMYKVIEPLIKIKDNDPARKK